MNKLLGDSHSIAMKSSGRVPSLSRITVEAFWGRFQPQWLRVEKIKQRWG
jgi:hypothetical protein